LYGIKLDFINPELPFFNQDVLVKYKSNFSRNDIEVSFEVEDPELSYDEKKHLTSTPE
jgi:hypothetical protein